MIFPDSALTVPYELLSNLAGLIFVGGGIFIFFAIIWAIIEGWDFEHPVRTPFIIALIVMPVLALGFVSASLAGRDLKGAELALVEQVEQVYGLEINEPVAEAMLGNRGLWSLNNQVELMRKPAETATFLSDGENLTVTLVWSGEEWLLVEGSEGESDPPHEELPRAGETD